MNKTQALALFVGIFVLVSLYTRFSSTPSIEKNSIEPSATVLAFGDSLTYGYGAVEAAYPKQLEVLINRKVVNAGVSGELSTQGLQRLPLLLKQYHPKLVILCHGGNDILRGSSKMLLKNNLLKMIDLSHKNGAEVLLVGVPSLGRFALTTEVLYDEVAEERHVLYEADILEEVESNPVLKSDRIHPNAQGYAKMAEAFAALLKEAGLL